MIAKGATTIWERWNGDTGDVAMNSFNHYALGAVAGFLFRRIAGIEPAAPGFRQITVAPVLDPKGRVRRAGADYDSVVGRISTDWTWTPGERFELSLTVPPNATAHVALPDDLGARATLDGVPRPLSFDVGAGAHRIAVGP
jgi:alpha-L-rhamnosidase